MARVTRSSARNKKPADEEAAASKPTKKATPKKKATQAKAPKPTKKAKKEETVASNEEGKTIVTVEACKQWGAFKTRANKIAKAVGDKAVVQINKEKPGKGNFVVRVSGVKDPIVELLGMKRPFPPLKALDMDDICAKVLEALSSS